MTRLIDRLITLHRAINEAVQRERRHLIPDPIRISALKKRRLAIKDRIHRALVRGIVTA